MNLKSSLVVAALVASTAFVTAQVVSQEKKEKPRGQEHGHAHDEHAEQAQQEGMPEWMKYTTPGEHHQKLEPFAGQWTYTIQMWEYPDAEPMETDGAIEYKWILDGRYLLGHYTGEFMGEAFEGFDLIGYDNFRGEYITLWIDSHSTAFTQSTGKFNEKKNAFTHRGQHDNVMTGQKNMPFKTTTGFDGEDAFTMKWMSPAENGEMFLGMKLVATRKP
ncbi:MAG: DUF1579 family protein [Planctomycetota bacterium]|jgi:hypothetical protein